MAWLSGLSAKLQTKGLLVQFPVRACGWVVGKVLARENKLYFDDFSLSFSLPSSL